MTSPAPQAPAPAWGTVAPDGPIRVAVVYGTRPEAIKMAPLVLGLRGDDRFAVDVLVTGQHREMLAQVHDVFGIVPDVDLDILTPGQSLTDVTTRTLQGMGRVLRERRPDAVLVQGDTTTTFAAALAAFYEKVPVVHTEAGLRTTDRYSPFPEELNRRMTTRLASLHLAPTTRSRENLLAEGIAPGDIVVTGNSVIDALLWTVRQDVRLADVDLQARLSGSGRPVVLVTAHRRESWGEPMRGIGRALARIARAHPDHDLLVPLHRNPLVREAIAPAIADLPNVLVTEPLAYPEFCWAMNRSRLLLSDSGGVQEEGPSLGKPVLVMRENTERPEAVDFGTARLVGTDEDRIVAEVETLLTDAAAWEAMASATNPYGDGHAAPRTADAIAHAFGRGPAATEFTVA